LRKEVFDLIKKEIKYIGFVFLIALVIFKIAFYKENLIVLLRNILSLFWLFVVPGYCFMLYWHDKLDFVERFIVGIALSAAIIGVFSYYLGLIGLNIKYHLFLFPVLISLIGLVMVFKKRNKPN